MRGSPDVHRLCASCTVCCHLACVDHVDTSRMEGDEQTAVFSSSIDTKAMTQMYSFSTTFLCHSSCVSVYTCMCVSCHHVHFGSRTNCYQIKTIINVP